MISKDGIVQKGEIAHRRELQAAHGSEGIIAGICSDLTVSREDLLREGRMPGRKARISFRSIRERPVKLIEKSKGACNRFSTNPC